MGIRPKPVDLEILRALYKCPFMTERQLAALTNYDEAYIKGRSKKLANAHLIERLVLSQVAVNYITADGIVFADLRSRKIHKPTMAQYEHALGETDLYVWLAIKHRFKDGKVRNYSDFGQIITERDFTSVREMVIVDRRKDGQPVYLSKDSDIHPPDGYYRTTKGTYVALEFERTPKASNAILAKNILANAERFRIQIWAFDSARVAHMLSKLKEETLCNMRIYDIRRIRKDIDEYVGRIPPWSAETDKRESQIGEIIRPIPLNRIPLL